MLQAPSHLSRVSGHNHFKKSWLMQTQNESQANVGCEKVYSLACSSSRPISCAPITGADAKQNSHLSAGNSSARRYITIGSSASCPIRPLVVAGPSIGATSIEGCGANAKELGKHVSLLARAESEPRSSVLSSHYSKDESYEEENDRLPFKRHACGSTSFPATFSPFVASSEDPLKQQSPKAGVNVLDEAQPKDYSQRFHCMSLGSTARSLQRENASSKLHLCVPESSTEGEASSEHGFGTSQKDFANVHDNSSSSPKQDCLEPEQCPESLKNEVDPDDLLNSRVDDTVEEQHLSLEKSGESCRAWMPFDSKGNSGICTVQTKAGRDDDMLEVDNAHEVNATYNDGSIGRSILRSCSHCGTTKTPLWRSGPQGPKSLCNACGIRFKKLRRSSGQNESSDLHVSPPVTPNANRNHFRSLKRKQDNTAKSPVSLSHEDGTKTAFKGEAPQICKKSRWPSLFLKDDVGQGEDGNRNSCESYLSWSLQSTSLASPSQKKVFYEKYFSLQDERDSKLATLEKHSILSRVFADEEEEAAVLLMALSCGLVNA